MRVKTRRQIMGKKGDPMGFVRLGGLPNNARILPEGSHQLPLPLVSQKREVGVSERLLTEIKVRKDQFALPHDATGASVGVLDVENWIVLALLDHLRQIEIERGVVLAHQHHEPDGVGADLVPYPTQRTEIAGTSR